MDEKQRVTEADIKATRKKRFYQANEGYLIECTRIAALFDAHEKEEPLFNDLTQTQQQAKLERDMDTKAKRRQTTIAEHFELACER